MQVSYFRKRFALEIQRLGDFVEVEDGADGTRIVRCLLPSCGDTTVEFRMNRRWPFRPPSVHVNEDDFFHFAGRIHHASSPEKAALVRRIWGRTTCGVCDSILCPDNWHPTSKLSDIVEEIVLHMEVRRRVRDRLRLRVAVGKWWNADIISVIESFM